MYRPLRSASGVSWGNGPMLRLRSPVRGGSTLMTVAPRSARIFEVNGAVTRSPTSTTRSPVNGPGYVSTGAVELSLLVVVIRALLRFTDGRCSSGAAAISPRSDAIYHGDVGQRTGTHLCLLPRDTSHAYAAPVPPRGHIDDFTPDLPPFTRNVTSVRRRNEFRLGFRLVEGSMLYPSSKGGSTCLFLDSVCS